MSGQPLLVARVAAHPTAVAAFLPVAVARGTVLWHERARRSALGVARRLALPRGLSAGDDVLAVQDALAGAEVVSDAAPAGAPLSAVGALPFDGTAGGELVVPATLLVEPAAGGGGAVAVLAGTDGAALARAARAWERGLVGDLPGVGHAGTPATEPPERFTLTSPGGHEAFRELVRCAVDDIRAGSLKKVVLVREVLVEADRPFPRSCLVERLRALYPSCTTFSVGGFVGASPELLVARAGVEVRAHPLAGTIGRSGDPATDARAEAALLASPKERSEHRVVVDAIAAVLRPLCDELDVPATPQIVELRNVSHLGSLLAGRLRAATGRAPGALELVAALHPTPAVAGTPTADALAWIDKHEGVDRGPYAGPVGWVDAEGDGEWFVGIRAGLFDGGCARLFAGVGVVADSDPDAELAETQLKLQALLAAAVRP